MVQIGVDFASPVPVYEQIKKGVKRAIAMQVVGDKETLPSIREMAGFFKINPNTVARAYRELQHEGVIGGRAGKGFWVEQKMLAGEEEKMELFKDDFLKLLEKGIEMGLSPDGMKKMIVDCFEEVK